MQEHANYRVVDGIALLKLDNPPVNSLSGAQRVRLDAQLRDAAQRADVRAIVVSGAGAVFCGGADVREFNTPAQKTRPTMPELIEGCDLIGKPVVAAIEGFAFGAGLELAMAMHYRIATPTARLGLPEVKFGFLPGAGGTQRLSRLVPVEKAAEMMMSGAPVDAVQARALGLVDELATGDLESAALDFTRSLLARGAPLRRTRDLPANTDTLPLGHLGRLYAELAGKPGTQVKQDIVYCCLAALDQPFDQALAKERARFLELLDSAESKALRHLFFAERAAARPARVGPEVSPRPIARAAVVGAGTMGSGIAVCFADAGIPVTLIDANPEALGRGLSAIAAIYQGRVAKGKLSAEQRDAVLARILPGAALDAAQDADIVVEAVFENLALKEGIFRELGQLTRPGAILASNTSMLDIDAIARASGRPRDVIGMHFFSPAHVMRLLEVVDCAETGDDVLLTVMQLARKLGKTAVASGVCDGFIGNRMLQKYVQQSMFLLDEGCSPAQVDRAMQRWGMAMGPFAVADLSGLDIGWAIRKRRYVERPDMVYSRIADRVCEAGRLGQKAGRGWYRYEAGQRTPLPDPECERILADYRAEQAIPQRSVSDEEIVQRLVFALVNEGVAILAEGIARRSADIDVVYTTGYGFPAARGGPMFYAEQLGLGKVLAAIEGFRNGYQGAQWIPHPLLVQLARRGLGFGAAAEVVAQREAA
jgi:3-hydroxyacyl-CoA dehydrogenase